jgi:hypothetical protein
LAVSSLLIQTWIIGAVPYFQGGHVVVALSAPVRCCGLNGEMSLPTAKPDSAA